MFFSSSSSENVKGKFSVIAPCAVKLLQLHSSSERERVTVTWMRESKVFFWWCSGMISVSSAYSLCASLTKALMQWMYESISTSKTSSFPDRKRGGEEV